MCVFFLMKGPTLGKAVGDHQRHHDETVQVDASQPAGQEERAQQAAALRG